MSTKTEKTKNPFRLVADLEKMKPKWLAPGTSIIVFIDTPPVSLTKVLESGRKVTNYIIETNYGKLEISAVQAMRIANALDSPTRCPEETTLTFIL